MDMERTILEQLRRRLPQYELCQGSREHLRDIYRLITGNEEFLKSTQAHEQTMEECEEALVARPPQVTAENKHFLVIYENGECVALLDYLEGYPEKETAYIGLFIVVASKHGNGIGRKINDAFMRSAQCCGYRNIKLGCHRRNESGYWFWRKNRYIAESVTSMENDGQAWEILRMGCDISDPHMFEPGEVRGTIYRLEEEKDYRAAESMTRRAFWNKHHLGCDEHYLVHCLRSDDAFVPEISLIAEVDDRIVGGIWYSKSQVKTGTGTYPVLTFGPLCVAPEYQGTGVGGQLLEKSMRLAREAGYPGIIIFGEPGYYPKHGFVTCDNFGITTADGKNFDAFMGIELQDGAFEQMRGGRFFEAEVFEHLSEEKVLVFDKEFPHMERLRVPGQWD